MHWTESRGGYWSITRYSDIVEISKRPDLFSSALENGGITIAGESDPEQFRDGASMITSDPPLHLKLRNLFAPRFSSRKIDEMESFVRDAVNGLFDELAVHREADWADAVAAELPACVMAKLLGIPASERRKLCLWSDTIDGQEDPFIAARPLSAEQAVDEMMDCGRRLAALRSAQPQDDLISLMVHRGSGGIPMPEEQYLANFAMFVIAGSETVRNCISGGLLALHAHPEQMRILARSPERLPGAIDEINRWVTPIYHFRRTAMCDLDFHGARIRKGQKVVLWYISGNRDPGAFDRPECFDITRVGQPSLSFGAGQHTCVGRRLADLELRVLFEQLLARFPKLVPSGPIRRLRSNFINGYTSLPVRVHG
ncbi:MAG TPA: cytochrome P450 [Rhizomicrobium sp.]|nr:cytochrome P450 [Rhizomicrobium sp.]